MVKVKVHYQEEKIVMLEAKGHANSAPHGEDLICASVSSIMTGGANEIANIDQNKCWNIELNEGYASIKLNNESKPQNQEVYVVLRTMLTMLKTIEESFPKFIKIYEE